MIGKLVAMVGILLLAGCRYSAPASIGAFNRVEYEREIQRGTSISTFRILMDVPCDEEYLKFVNELAGRAWWINMGKHGKAPDDCEGIYVEYMDIVKEKYSDDFDLSAYGLDAVVEGRIERMDERSIAYRVKVTFQPVGNPAWVCEISGEYIKPTVIEVPQEA